MTYQKTFEEIKAELYKQKRDKAEIELIEDAFKWACTLHEGQYRISGEPYIIHPVEVAKILVDLKLDKDTIIAAFLHDILEDTDTTAEQMCDKFGQDVVNLVQGVTKLSKYQFKSKEERQAENFRRMFIAMAQDIRIIVLKLADRLHNMRTLSYMAAVKQKKIAQETIDIFAPLANRLGMGKIKAELEDLAQEIIECNNHDTTLAFCIIDIANISEINAELGHARGDDVIREVAKKIQKNVRNTDILGRYGGDEVAIIMPNTSIDEAKYICEFLFYNLSCTMFDDLGQLQFSCGISMCPSDSNNQEKINILAQQALYIAKSKRSRTGQSEIVATNEYNFWDEEAVKGFAYVLSKKHATTAVNIEEELINQFHSENILSSDHLLEVVSSLAAAIDAKDTYTKGHSAAVSRYSEALARAINLPAYEVERIKLGAMLHDIGKIGIPEHILRKPTTLSEQEWQIMRQHPTIGADKVLKPNQSLHDLIPMVKYHHEHLDGSGYPYGLKGDEIPQSARIVAIADAFHALISDRPYRKGLSVAKACEILKMGAGIQWDKDLIRQFIIIAPSLATAV